MSDSTVGLPPDSTGKEVRTFRQTVGANQVEVQGIALCDPVSSAAVASVVASAPATNAAGLVTRPLPFGTEATAAKQDTGNASLASMLATLTSVLTALQGTLTTSAAALPLPSGAATQATLANVLTALQSTLTVGLSGAVEIANDSGNPLPVSGTVTASGPLTDMQLRATPVPVSMSGANGGLTDTQLRATAVSVAVSNLPSTQAVSGTVTANAGLNLNTAALALETGNLATLTAKDFATQTTLAAILAKLITSPATEVTLGAILAKLISSPATETTLSALSGKIPALGGAAAAASLPVVLSNDGPFVAATGVITETAPATDTASSGLNGRLQRIAQRITSLLALLPASLGIKTAANSLSIAPASDAIFTVSSVGVTYTNRSGTITAGGTAQTLATANAGRKGFWIQNNSAGDLWINDLGTATQSQPSLKIPVSQSMATIYEYPANGVPVTALSIIGATTGQAWSAREY